MSPRTMHPHARRPSSPASRISPTAWHEAGHASVATEIGQRVKGITLEWQPHADGMVDYETIDLSTASMRDFTIMLLRQIVVAAAGTIAERRGTGHNGWVGDTQDQQLIARSLAKLTNSPSQRRAIARACHAEAERRVEASLGRIERLASILENEQTLDGDAVRILLATDDTIGVAKSFPSALPIVPVPGHAVRLPPHQEAIRLAGRAVTQTRLGFPSLRSVTLNPVPPGEEIRNFAPSPNQIRNASRIEQNDIARATLLAMLVGEIAVERATGMSLDAFGAVERSGGREYLNILGDSATERVRVAEALFQEALATVMRREGVIHQVAAALVGAPDKTLTQWQVGAIMGPQRGLP